MLFTALLFTLAATTIATATDDSALPTRKTPTDNAPAWARAQRELLVQNWDVVDAMLRRQRHNVKFWGDPNDAIVPLGWMAPPFLGHEQARKSWLQFYEQLEGRAALDFRPGQMKSVDPEYILDFLGSRGITLYFAPGDPQVFERELNVAKRYSEWVADVNAKRANLGLPPLTGDRAMRDDPQTDPIDQIASEILFQSRARLGWWGGETETPPPHVITDRDAVAAQLLQAAKEVGDKEVQRLVSEARVGSDYPAGIGRDILIHTALGGGVQGDVGPKLPSIAVTWEDADTPELARLVSYADESRLVVNALSFLERGFSTKMRVWRLQPGTYKLRVGSDANDDGVIDGAPKREETVQLDRLSKISLHLAPGENTVLTLDLIEARKLPKRLPDLAISHEDVVVDGYTVHVTVHNIGAASAENVRVALLNGSGDVIEEKVIPRLASPQDDLIAKQVTVNLALNDREVIVCVDPKWEIDELSEENNQVYFILTRGKSEAVLAEIRPATEAQIEQALEDIKHLDEALKTYKVRFGHFPKMLKELLSPPDGPPLLENGEIPLDPWGNYYGYRVVRHGRTIIVECWTPDEIYISNHDLPD